MKRSRKTLFALLLALVMTLGLAATAWATGDATIVGGLDDSVANHPTSEEPGAYKIPFTKVVVQAGAFAPGPKNFSLEAFLPNGNGGADTPLYTFDFGTSGTGIGSFPGEMTIPAADVPENIEGFYVREMDATDAGWKYSKEVYFARFSNGASDGNNVRTLTLYTTQKTDIGYEWEREHPVDRMTFTNTYTENLATVAIPFTKTVKLGGNTAPGKTDFELEIFDIRNSNKDAYKDVTCTAAVTTNGAGSYDGKLVISGPADQIREFVCEGFSVREKNNNLPGWTYSDAVWRVEPEAIPTDGSVPELKIYPAKMEKTGNGEFYVPDWDKPKGEMTFENTYTYNHTTHARRTPEQPNTPETAITAPKTFDAGVALYGVSALLSLTGAALVIKRKNG